MHQIHAGVYMWEAPTGRLYLVTPDGSLLQSADGIEPGPPPGYVRAMMDTPDGPE